MLNKPLLTPALDFEFSFSGKSLDESLHKQLSYGGSYIEFAKAIANMDVLLKNAGLLNGMETNLKEQTMKMSIWKIHLF